MLTKLYVKVLKRFDLRQPVISKSAGRFVIKDYRIYKYSRSNKRALLCYLTVPVKDNLEGRTSIQFSNHGIALSWARSLNELGYTVDIVDWDNNSFKPSDKYDLVVFHGGIAFNSIWPRLQFKEGGRVIHFLTGTYWKYNNQAEAKRFKDFKRRHGVEPPRDRLINADEDKVSDVSDGVIVIGSDFQQKTYPKKPRVIAVNNATFADAKYSHPNKDYDSAKKKFFFFAGGGNIHKGMDILVDVFSKLDAELYIACSLDQPVVDALKKQLALPNIHIVGHIGMRSPEYYEIVNQCGYVILPSCSEGQPGSVLECMQHGLVPVVSVECGIPVEDFGYLLKTSTIEEVMVMVQKLIKVDKNTLQVKSDLARKVTRELYSPRMFMVNLKQAISEITHAK